MTIIYSNNLRIIWIQITAWFQEMNFVYFELFLNSFAFVLSTSEINGFIVYYDWLNAPVCLDRREAISQSSDE